MQLSNAPAIKTPNLWAVNAGANLRIPPNPSQIPVTDGAASFVDGFVPLNFTPVAAGGVPPFGKDMNGVLNQITSWDQWFQAGGIIRYDPTFQAQIGGYPSQARVGSLTTPFLVWYSTTDNNRSNPDTGGAGWEPPVFPDPLQGALTITTAGTAGANIAFVGDGTVAPRKWLRAFGGKFSVMSNAYADIFTLDDAGNVSNIGDVTANGTLSAYALTTNGPLPNGGKLSVSGNATIAGTLGVTGAITCAANVKGATITATGLATAGMLSVGTTAAPAGGAGYAYFLKGLESGGTLKVDSFTQLAGAVNIGGQDASIYWTNSGGADWGGQRGFIHRKFSANPNGNDPVNDVVTLGAWTNGGPVENALNVITIDPLGGLTVYYELTAGYQDVTGNNHSVLRFRDATGLKKGSIYRDSSVNRLYLKADESANNVWIDQNGNLTATGTVHGSNITLMDLAIDALHVRLAALEARA